MTDPKPRRRSVDRWETVAFTALPVGWRNAYQLDDNTVSDEPCPGVLIQELRSTDHYKDIPTGGDPPFRLNETTTTHEAPYETRVEFACQDGTGGLHPASEVGNYLGTAGPGDPPPEART